MLKEAGYANGLTLEFQSSRSRDWASVIGDYLKKVGINTNIDFLPYTNTQDRLAKNQFQLYLTDDGSLSINDTYAFLNRVMGPPYDATNNPQVQDLLTKAEETADPDVRKKFYSQVLALISDQMYMLPLWSHPQIYGIAKESGLPALVR